MFDISCNDSFQQMECVFSVFTCPKITGLRVEHIEPGMTVVGQRLERKTPIVRFRFRRVIDTGVIIDFCLFGIPMVFVFP